MRNVLISLLSTLFLIVLALALVPFFVSTDFLKAQVEQFVEDQSGMRLDIAGDVSLSLLTGLQLSAETVSLRAPDDKPLFATDRLDFSLALTPLLSGKADITGITLNHPVITLNASNEAANSDTVTNEADGEKAQNEPIDLSALSLRRLTIRDAEIVSIDAGDHSKSIISQLDLTLRIPDFEGAVDISGSLPFQSLDHQFSGSIAHAGKAINGEATQLSLSVESDVQKSVMEGTVALKSSQILIANFASNVGNVTQFFDWLGATPSPLAVGKASITGSLEVAADEITLPSITLSLDEQKLEAAARIYTGSWLERPLIRVAIDNSTLDLDALLPSQPQAGTTDATSSSDSQSEGTTPPDLSALTTLDMTLDVRSGRLSYQGKSIRKFKLLAHIIDGQLSAELKSANIAQGNIQAKINGTLDQLIWNGTVTARGLDANELASLGNQKSPLSGTLSTDINFAVQGLDMQQMVKNGNLAGVIALDGGEFSHPALQSAIPNKESGTLSNLNTRITIANLEAPVDAKGSFGWNGETIRYASTFGIGEALTGNPVPVSLSLDARPVSIGLTGLANPATASLSGSKLSLKSSSSRALLAWLGQAVSSGTPDIALSLSTKLALTAQKTSLNDLSLQMGQSKGTGAVTYSSSGKPLLTGTLAFQTLDLTPFMGDGSKQGGTTSSSRSSSNQTASGWDTSPIDLSGLNNLNADLALTTQSLIARDIKAGPVSMKIKLTNGQLNGTLDQLSLYGGKGTGGISINAQSSPARMGANFTLSGMQMSGFLRDSIALNSLSGTGGVTLDLQTSGASQAQLIQQLDGTGNMEIRDGQLRGINIPQMLRSLKGNILEGWASSEAQSTDFSALKASFQFDKGIVKNSDLQMLSPLLRLTGAGTVDLPNKRIDYRATPKLISKLKGQGGLVDADGVPIPIIIKGKLEKPRIYPDIPGILENPQAILKSLQQLGGTGKAASEGIKKLEQNVTKEIQKQSEKLGINLDDLINPNAGNNQDQQNNQQQKKSVEEQLFRDLTKGLFGN